LVDVDVETIEIKRNKFIELQNENHIKFETPFPIYIYIYKKN